MLIAVVDEALHRYQLQGRVLFVACSGGRDSLALAYACICLLHQQKQKTNFRLVLLHVNHHLQAAADSWAGLVQNFAQTHAIACQVLDVVLKNSGENAARIARYRALFSAMSDGGVLLFGHHSDDNAETLLMRLVNGTSLQGLAGMPAYRTSEILGKTVHICRPLLTLSRQDITNFAKKHHLPFIDDPTNTDGDNARSFIRKYIMPQLAQLNPQVTANIARTSALLNHSATMIAETFSEKWQTLHIAPLSVVPHTGQGSAEQKLVFKRLPIDRLHRHSLAWQQELLWHFIRGNETYGANYAFVQRVLALCQRTNPNHKTLLQWQGYVFCRYDNFLYRYKAVFWQNLHKHDSFVAIKNDCLHLCLGDECFLLDGSSNAVPIKISKNCLVVYRHKTLSGKKLYQTLRIPVWLRGHLYLLGDKIVSFGHVWVLGT